MDLLKRKLIIREIVTRGGEDSFIRIGKALYKAVAARGKGPLGEAEENRF